MVTNFNLKSIDEGLELTAVNNMNPYCDDEEDGELTATASRLYRDWLSITIFCVRAVMNIELSERYHELNKKFEIAEKDVR